MRRFLQSDVLAVGTAVALLHIFAQLYMVVFLHALGLMGVVGAFFWSSVFCLFCLVFSRSVRELRAHFARLEALKAAAPDAPVDDAN